MFESSKVVFIIMLQFWQCLQNCLGLTKIKTFWNKDYDVIISIHDLTKNILSHDSSSIADVVMWPKFDDSITS